MKDKQDADKLKLAPRPSNLLNILSYQCKNIILYTINNNNQVNIVITPHSASIKLMDSVIVIGMFWKNVSAKRSIIQSGKSCIKQQGLIN